MSDLPAGSYLMSEYHDGHRRLEIRTVYYDDGRVELSDAEGTMTVCVFTPEQVARAKDAIRASGLLSASDLSAEGVHDSATFTYLWKLDGQSGSVTNAAYPTRQHTAFKILEEQLNAIEEECNGSNSNGIFVDTQ